MDNDTSGRVKHVPQKKVRRDPTQFAVVQVIPNKYLVVHGAQSFVINNFPTFSEAVKETRRLSDEYPGNLFFVEYPVS